MFTGGFRKTIGLFFIAFGVGIILTLILPFWSWIAIISGALIILGISWLFC